MSPCLRGTEAVKVGSTRPTRVGLLCAQHLAAGRCCDACMADHLTASHSPAMEATCDGCGAVDRGHILGVSVLERDPFRVRKLDRRMRTMGGNASVIGVGVCRACRAVKHEGAA